MEVMEKLLECFVNDEIDNDDLWEKLYLYVLELEKEKSRIDEFLNKYNKACKEIFPDYYAEWVELYGE